MDRWTGGRMTDRQADRHKAALVEVEEQESWCFVISCLPSALGFLQHFCGGAFKCQDPVSRLSRAGLGQLC